jgi:hypothetical protein
MMESFKTTLDAHGILNSGVLFDSWVRAGNDQADHCFRHLRRAKSKPGVNAAESIDTGRHRFVFIDR